MRVKIPFRDQFEKPMIDGRKTATSRTSEMGQIGDTFEAFGAIFLITGVRQVLLQEVAEKYFREEGLESPLAFMQVWKSIHPVRGYDPEDVVYLHTFQRATEQL